MFDDIAHCEGWYCTLCRSYDQQLIARLSMQYMGFNSTRKLALVRQIELGFASWYFRPYQCQFLMLFIPILHSINYTLYLYVHCNWSHAATLICRIPSTLWKHPQHSYIYMRVRKMAHSLKKGYVNTGPEPHSVCCWLTTVYFVGQESCHDIVSPTQDLYIGPCKHVQLLLMVNTLLKKSAGSTTVVTLLI